MLDDGSKANEQARQRK